MGNDEKDSDITTGVNSRELEFLERISGSRIDNRPIRIDGEQQFGTKQSSILQNKFQFGQVNIELNNNTNQVFKNFPKEHRNNQVRRIHQLIHSDKHLQVSQIASNKENIEIQQKDIKISSNFRGNEQTIKNNHPQNNSNERAILQTNRQQLHFHELQRTCEESNPTDELKHTVDFEKKLESIEEINVEKETHLDITQKELAHRNHFLLQEQKRKVLEDQRKRELEEKRQIELKKRRQQEIKDRRQKEIEEKRQKEIAQLRQKKIEEKRQRLIEEQMKNELEEKKLIEIEEKRKKEIEEKKIMEIEEKRKTEMEEILFKEIEEKRL